MKFLRQFLSAGRNRPTSARLRLEALEDRLLLSADCPVISGHVYHDANNNGLRDAGETPVAGSTIELRNASNIVVGSTTTDANGAYQFSTDSSVSSAPTYLDRLAAFASAPTDWTQTQAVAKFDPTLGTLTSVEIIAGGTVNSQILVENTSTSSSSLVTATISGALSLTGPGVSSLVVNPTANAGTFSATVYDGLLNFAGSSGHDFGLQTATGSNSVTLTSAGILSQYTGTGSVQFTQTATATSRATGGGNLVSSIITSAAGQLTVRYHYIPSNCLHPGNYTIVQKSQPAGYLDGRESRGGVVVPNSAGTDVIPLTVTAADFPNNDFGELRPASLAGSVYLDGNNNGVKNSGENGIAAVLVTLTGTDDRGTVNRTMLTGTNGAYQFINLRPGQYTLAETQPTAYLDGKDALGSLGGTLANDQFSAVPVVAGQAGVNYNFGEITPASLSGIVYVDANNNGIKDTGEAALANATVTLTGTDDRGTAVSATRTTQPDGSYQFLNLRPGTYALAETQPAALLDGKDTIGSAGGTLANDRFSAIPLAMGVAGIRYNFGELLPASLSGVVFADANNDCLKQPSEAGISGVTVTLTGMDDLGPVSRSTVTGSLGGYSFANLRPGVYTLTESQPAGYLDGKEAAGSAGGTVGDDKVSAIALAQGQAGINYDFCELRPASLSGFVYVDANNNGIKEANEAPIADATVTLSGTNDLGVAISLGMATGADGSYTFGDLRPGLYAVTETQPPEYLDGKDAVGSAQGTAANDRVSAITLPVGLAAIDYNFGELLPASLSGLVYADTNHDCFKQPDEAGISGVTVTLTGTDDLGSVSRTTVTGSLGEYSFLNLRPGVYTITETQPAGFLSGGAVLGSAGGSVAENQVSAIALGHDQVGTGYNFCELLPASLSGYVFVDANNNGLRDVGEQGIAGTTVTLTGSSDLGPISSVSTVTDDAGGYGFGGLRPGSYTVTETQPSNYQDGKEQLGSAGGTLADDRVSAITLGAGVAAYDYNFGELLPSTPAPPTQEILSVYFACTTPPVQFALPPSVADLSKQQLLSNPGQVPWTDMMLAQATFVDGLYVSLLGRHAEPVGIMYWVQQFQLGATRTQVVQSIWNSTEHRAGQVEEYYQRFLQRSADGGAVYWVSLLQAGVSESTVARLFVASPEYQAKNATDAAYIEGLYHDIVGRSANPPSGYASQAEIAYWQNVLDQGVSRDALAGAFLGLQETYANTLTCAYSALLNRTIDGVGQQYFLSLLLTGKASPQAVMEAIWASDEVFANAARASKL